MYGNPSVIASSPRIRHAGSSFPIGFQLGLGITGSARMLAASSAMCKSTCVRGSSRRTTTCAYRYPRSSTAWKKSRHVVHTAADPPNHGSTILAMMGSTSNSRNALRKIVTAYKASGVPRSSATKATPAPLLVSCDAGDSLADNEGVDVVGSFISLNCFQIAQMPHDRILVRNPVRPQQVAAQARAVERHR